MQYVNEWTTPDRRRLVVIEPAVLKVFVKFHQGYFWQPESGGILLGKRRGKHIEVLLATEPMVNDIRSQFFFQREVEGHAAAAVDAWRAGNYLVDYVGEWHTHPQGIPIPSGIDRAEWHKLSAGRSNDIPLIAVVVGTQALHVEFLTNQRHIALEPLIALTTVAT